MPVADTSFIVDLMRRDPDAVSLYRQYEDREQVLLTTAVSALELFKGACLSEREENLKKVRAILELFMVIPIGEDIFEIFGRTAAELRTRGVPMGDFDELIAAITLVHDGEIITRDRLFAKVPGLRVITY